jgi:hypothetical protein
VESSCEFSIEPSGKYRVASQLAASGVVLSSIELLLFIIIIIIKFEGSRQLFITKLPVIGSLLNYFLYFFVYKIIPSNLILISLTAMLS